MTSAPPENLAAAALPRIHLRDISLAVARHYKIPHDRILAKGDRRPCIAIPRMVAMYLARGLTAHSHEQIGRHFGGRHPSTVSHAVSRILALAAQDYVHLQDLLRLIADITGAPAPRQPDNHHGK